MATTDRPPSPGPWIAFLACAFLVVGMMGFFATYAAPLPWQRLVAREAALDDAEAAAHGPDPQAALARLRDRLDDSAPAVLAPETAAGSEKGPAGQSILAKSTQARSTRLSGQGAPERAGPRTEPGAELSAQPGAAASVDARIAQARAAARARLEQEADVITTRLRWLVVVVTVMGAAFGAAVLQASRRSR